MNLAGISGDCNFSTFIKFVEGADRMKIKTTERQKYSPWIESFKATSREYIDISSIQGLRYIQEKTANLPIKYSNFIQNW